MKCFLKDITLYNLKFFQSTAKTKYRKLKSLIKCTKIIRKVLFVWAGAKFVILNAIFWCQTKKVTPGTILAIFISYCVQ